MGVVINIKEHERLSLEHCKEMLSENGKEFTDVEVKRIMEFVYILVEISYNIYLRKINEKKSNTIRESLHRRAG